MARKPGPIMLYPLRITDIETGSAVTASSLTEARKKLREYIRQKRGEYYLGNPIPYVPGQQKYVLVLEEKAQSPTTARSPIHHASAESMARQTKALRQCGGDN